jgi:hypothetical protein
MVENKLLPEDDQSRAVLTAMVTQSEEMTDISRKNGRKSAQRETNIIILRLSHFSDD